MAARPVYLDHHATTPVDPRVMDAMQPFFTERFGNAASVNHAFGIDAAEAVETAREQVARLLGVEGRSLVFTSGATEANNLALKGVLWAGGTGTTSGTGSHLVVNAAEHRSVLDPAKRLQRDGYQVTVIGVDRFGRVDPQQVADALSPNTVLVSVMLANNEVGTINPIAEIGRICREHNVLLHCDAVQAASLMPIDLSRLPIDLLSLTAHKMYGPKGIGALYVRREGPRIRMQPLFDGGGHEQHLRSGTLPVPLIVGFGRTCELVCELMPGESDRLGRLRDRLWDGLRDGLEGVILNGHLTERLPNNLNVSFEGVHGDALMASLTEIAVSSGSACTTAEPEPSHVLRAMGASDALTRASVRFGLGRFNTEADVDFAVQTVCRCVTRLRELASTSGVQ